MTAENLIDIMRNALLVACTIAAPAIVFGMVAGVAVSVFQATTQINDFTLVFVPKVLATLLSMVIFGAWMLQTYLDFMREMILKLPMIG